MADLEVTCVNKPDRMSRHEHITYIGNSAARWRYTREQAIQMIDNKLHTFHTVDRRTGARAYVVVVREAGRPPYLRTKADGKLSDNLLALAECPLA